MARSSRCFVDDALEPRWLEILLEAGQQSGAGQDRSLTCRRRCVARGENSLGNGRKTTSSYKSLSLWERLGEGQQNCRSYFSSVPYGGAVSVSMALREIGLDAYTPGNLNNQIY